MYFKSILEGIGEGVLLTLRSLMHLPSLPRQFHRFLDYSLQIGYATVPIVAILSFFIGGVLALQSGDAFQTFQGANQQFLGPLVGLSVVRELGPVMVAFLLAGRVGSAVTAELASMKVYNEVDALRTMNIPPEKILVMPRLASVFVMMPLLTIVGIVIAWLGGQIVAEAVGFINVSSETYWQTLRGQMTVGDLVDGLIKAQIFGFLVILIACTEGLRTKGGPREVGNAVTRSVVAAMVTVLLLDYFITKVLI